MEELTVWCEEERENRTIDNHVTYSRLEGAGATEGLPLSTLMSLDKVLQLCEPQFTRSGKDSTLSSMVLNTFFFFSTYYLFESCSHVPL